MDLGVSSHQLDAGERGFSLMRDGPLDMRMDRRVQRCAEDIVNQWPEEKLANLFWELGEERGSRKVARVLVHERKTRPIRRTTELADLVERALGGRRGRIHPATRVFQAIRMEVNGEMDVLREGLDGAWRILKAGGRLAVISFHSMEDREVKRRFQKWVREEKSGELIFKKPLVAGDEEMRGNPRSRSAKLRIVEKV